MSARQATSSVRVRYAETDKMGVVYYSNYLIWFEIGRTDWLRETGLDLSRDGSGRHPAARHRSALRITGSARATTMTSRSAPGRRSSRRCGCNSITKRFGVPTARCSPRATPCTPRSIATAGRSACPIAWRTCSHECIGHRRRGIHRVALERAIARSRRAACAPSMPLQISIRGH